jgi:putative nucleotidyltransferase with HDIG domain
MPFGVDKLIESGRRNMKKSREEALELLKQHNQSDALIRHAYAVEGVMRRFADRFGEDAEYWGIVGLLHDVDYEKWPEEHLKVAPKLLEEAGFDEDFIHAVCSHGWGLCSDVKPEKKMEIVLYTIDELTGLITAAAYMRPSRSVMDMEVKSVRKKFKDKGFAAGVNRDVIRQGCEMLGLELDDVIFESIEGMRGIHTYLGL